MKNFNDEYQKKLVSVETALSHIPSGSCIASAMCAMEPQTLLNQLHTVAQRGDNFRVITGLVLGKYPFMQDPEYKHAFKVEDSFFMGAARNSYQSGIASYSPCNLHSFSSRLFDKTVPNVALLSASEMDKDGYFSCSLCSIYEQELVERADLVILEVNSNMPVVYGDTHIHIRDVDFLIETNTPVPQLQKGIPTEEDKKIGAYIADLVHDGDTIQLGIGGIPDAVAQFLMDKKELGVHTEMLTNSIVDLVEAGVITNQRKTLNKGKMIATFAFGNEALYRMMDRNPSVELLRASYVNDPFVIAQNDNMVSINTCIAADLTGQVASETLGFRQYSGSGGQSDTAFGATHAKNGRSIIALHSTAKQGAVSTISAMLPTGSVVTLSRNVVDYIVTEYGVAAMRGRSIRERVENLIAVAHPDFRKQLRADAEACMFI